MFLYCRCTLPKQWQKRAKALTNMACSPKLCHNYLFEFAKLDKTSGCLNVKTTFSYRPYKEKSRKQKFVKIFLKINISQANLAIPSTLSFLEPKYLKFRLFISCGSCITGRRHKVMQHICQYLPLPLPHPSFLSFSFLNFLLGFK